MKVFGKILVLSLIGVFSFGISHGDIQNPLDFTEVLKKEKPKPVYEFDQESKKFKFVDAVGEYRVNNMCWDVVKEGKIEEKNVVLDLSNLTSGEYIVEIEFQGYVFIEDIFL